MLSLVLEREGFGESRRRWIRGCLSNSHFFELVTGAPREWFNSSRGLYHGDPSSPFLFTLVVDELEVGGWVVESVMVGREEIQVSHLKFGDNTILFLDADVHKTLISRF